MCGCFTPTKLRFDNTNAQPHQPESESVQEIHNDSTSDEEDHNEEYNVGRFVIVKYNGKPFIAQVTKLHDDNVEVNCMVQHKERNVFTWPLKPDYIFYSKDKIVSAISEQKSHQHAAQPTRYECLLFSEFRKDTPDYTLNVEHFKLFVKII